MPQHAKAGLLPPWERPRLAEADAKTDAALAGARAVGAEIAGLEEGSELTGGEWPGPVTADELSGVQPVPVALLESAARELGLSIGSTLVLKDLIQKTAQPVTVTPARIRRMESRSLRTANGIEVKIPTELLNAESEVEFLHADDGSISLLIKNVIL